LPTEAIVGLFTLGGVALGFAGQWFMEGQRVHRSRVGMVKAMLGELRANAAGAVRVLYAGPGNRSMLYSSETWRAANFELAQFIPDNMYEDLLLIYQLLPDIQRLSDTPRLGWSEDTVDLGVKSLLEQWIERIKRTMNDLLKLPEAATFRHQWRIRPVEEDLAHEAKNEVERS
jgi:hypothetical protein